MKFEYSDFYKFIASLGISLVSVALLIPWLFLREPFDLLQKQDSIEQLTPVAQSIIAQRQALVEISLKIIPWFSLLAFLFGLFIFVYGVWKWLTGTQRFLEKYNTLKLELLEGQLPPISLEETKATKVKEITAQLEADDEILPDAENLLLVKDITINKVIKAAYDAENHIRNLLIECFKSSHKILTERRLGAASFDIVLLDKSDKAKDYVFEIKYIRKGFKYNWLRDNNLKMIIASELYQKELLREVTPVLFVVIPKNISVITTEIYLAEIRQENENQDIQSIVLLMTENQLEALSCEKLKKQLSDATSQFRYF